MSSGIGCAQICQALAVADRLLATLIYWNGTNIIKRPSLKVLDALNVPQIRPVQRRERPLLFGRRQPLVVFNVRFEQALIFGGFWHGN